MSEPKSKSEWMQIEIIYGYDSEGHCRPNVVIRRDDLKKIESISDVIEALTTAKNLKEKLEGILK